jgi:ribose transport system ATP-binding protein
MADLSGGNQQKVVLAKWLSDERLRVLVLDHPMRGLDPGAIENVKAAVRRASEEGVAVLMIADTLEEALETADFVTVMKDGAATGSFDLATQRTSVIDLLEKLV